MSTRDTEICGFLYVKSTGSGHVAYRVKKRTLALSKLWKRSWCSVRKLGEGSGLQVQFNRKLTCRSNALKQSEKDSSVTIPPGAVVHRICSRTKQFAFGVSPVVDRKPLLSLSANSETETQRWMTDIRHLLKPRRHCCAERSYDISMVDNAHSKTAGLTGIYGDLVANEIGIFIRNVHTGEIAETFEWKEFTQFHLMTAGRPEDVKRICVMHTSKEFRCGVGELYVFCLDANKLLRDLVTQGRGPRHQHRSSRYNSDLEMAAHSEISSLPLQLKSDAVLCTLHTDANCLRTSVGTKAVENIYQPEPNPMYGGKSHSRDHRESNISITSGIYEEIKDDVCSPRPRTLLRGKAPCNSQADPPALPPRQKQGPECAEENSRIDMEQYSRSETSDHFERRLQNMVCARGTALTDSSYVPMSPQLRDLGVLESDISDNSKENDYVIMR
ncbi:PREDICTED: uncharacterized protein LOC105560556 [Vollenhovia emeryi]|uniref:uncharacterized protein LOC105560556 n=1 Tax=Vollenhovia emeryi TaxID=411798 RepID=UPI0005F5621F|nr:PREDICTED: uncharacterized protein LOC105560556 [Vollenhovia emeryi]